MMDRSKLKVGMKVKLVDKEPKHRVFGGFVDRMEAYLGKEVTISRVTEKYFLIKEDGEKWVWDYCLIDEKSRFEKVTKWGSLHERIDGFARLSRILPVGTWIEKVIINGNCVITFFKNEKGEQLKKIARCSEEDSFDLTKGVEICIQRAMMDITKKELSILTR